MASTSRNGHDAKSTPAKSKQHPNLSSTPMSTSLVINNADAPSSSESIRSNVFDEPADGSLLPPSSPTTPPCDHKNISDEGSPAAKKTCQRIYNLRPRQRKNAVITDNAVEATRPPLRRSGRGRKSVEFVNVVGTLFPVVPASPTQGRDGDVFGPGLGTNATSDGGLSADAGRHPEDSQSRESGSEYANLQHTEAPPVSSMEENAELESKISERESFNAVDEVVANAEISGVCTCSNPKYHMPGSWESQCECSAFASQDEYDAAGSIQSTVSIVAHSMPNEEPAVQPLQTGISSSNQSSKRRKGKERQLDSLDPIPPCFLPYNQHPVNINQKLFRFFGGDDVKNANRAKRTRRDSFKDAGSFYSVSTPPITEKRSLGDGYGYVYLYELPEFPGFIKIGMTERSIEQREQELKRECGFPIQIIYQSCEKPFYNCNLVEKIIHIELAEQRRTFMCGKCLTKDPTNKYRTFRLHGEWFEVSKERAIEVANQWRRWAAPNLERESSFASCKTWWPALNTMLDKGRDLWYEIFVITPYGTDLSLRGCWVRRYHALPSNFQDIDWNAWREPPGHLELGREFLDFAVVNFRNHTFKISQLGLSTRTMMFWFEEVVKNAAALLLLSLPLVVSLLCWIISRSVWGVGAGPVLAFAYFVLGWLFERSR